MLEISHNNLANQKPHVSCTCCIYQIRECALNLKSAGAGPDGQEIPVPIVLLHGVVLMDIVKNLSNVSVKMVMLVKIVMLQWPLTVIGVNGAPGQHVLQGANKLEPGSVMTHRHLVGGGIVQKMEVSQLKQEIVPNALQVRQLISIKIVIGVFVCIKNDI